MTSDPQPPAAGEMASFQLLANQEKQRSCILASIGHISLKGVACSSPSECDIQDCSYPVVLTADCYQAALIPAGLSLCRLGQLPKLLMSADRFMSYKNSGTSGLISDFVTSAIHVFSDVNRTSGHERPSKNFAT